MLDSESIKEYWENRAASDKSPQSTTQDFYLRAIEMSVLTDRIKSFRPKKIADIGCGDGLTITHLAQLFKDIVFFGYDYSSAMIRNALSRNDIQKNSNINFHEHDILENLNQEFDLVYTVRCLINLPSWDLQCQATMNILNLLPSHGIYIMIENFIESHDKFNEIRRRFGLPEIAVREHNLFFNKNKTISFLERYFDIIEDINISSTYYLVSRVIYSKICSESGKQPDYFDEHHRLAAELPFCGEYGPVRLLCLKKRV